MELVPYILVFIVGGVAALVLRKLITKQPLLKARADAVVDRVSERFKEKAK